MRAYRTVDVFGSAPLTGNPVAVAHDAEGLTDEQMLAFTRWVNLSETTFLLPPSSDEADYRVRIFTLSGELPFAGHPTLGTAHAWLEAGGRPHAEDEVVQECGVGLVRLRRDAGVSADGLAFAAPPTLRGGPVDEATLAEVAGTLGIAASAIVDARWVDNGPGWVGVRLADAEAVLALEPAARAGERAPFVGVVGLHPDGAECAYEVRGLFPGQGGALIEDPVTGSLNASVARWLLGTGLVTAPYVAAQGTRVGRRGRVRIDVDPDGTVWVGGATTTVVTGTADL